MPFDSDLPREFHAAPLVRLAPDGGWQTALAHSRNEHLLIWITRGQGRFFLNGEQRGFGLHSVIFVPAGALWSAEFSRQCLGQVLSMTGPLLPPFPEAPVHKRFTSLQEQTGLGGHFEAISREQAGKDSIGTAPCKPIASLQPSLCNVSRTRHLGNLRRCACAGPTASAFPGCRAARPQWLRMLRP